MCAGCNHDARRVNVGAGSGQSDSIALRFQSGDSAASVNNAEGCNSDCQTSHHLARVGQEHRVGKERAAMSSRKAWFKARQFISRNKIDADPECAALCHLFGGCAERILRLIEVECPSVLQNLGCANLSSKFLP
jgi:hypothetical protein